MITQPVRRAAERSDSSNRRAPAWALTIAFLGALAYAYFFGLAISEADTDMLGALTVAPVLIASIVPFALRIARTDGDPTLVGVVMAAIVAKLLASGLRYYVAFEVYGNSDSLQYRQAALDLAPNFRRGIFDPGLGAISGTVFVKVLTGIVYAVLGESTITAFLVFAWMGFFGLLLLARAFRIAIPQGDSRRYLILVLFLPSLLYWPSAIGKEAWMMLTIGLCAYGIAHLTRGHLVGVAPLTLGLVGVAFVRPHIGIILFIGFVFAMLVRRSPAHTYAAPLFRFLGLLSVLVVLVVLVQQTATFLGEESITSEVVSGRLVYNETQTADGGSEFSPVVVRTPLDMAPALVTILFRPFPNETSNAQSLIASAEGLLLLFLTLQAWRRLRAIPRLIRTTPYVAFCLGYVLAFTFAFSSFSNFGILARQRVQALPFFLVFLALPEFQTLPSLKAAREQRRRRTRPLTAPPRRRVRRPSPTPPVGAAPRPEPVRDGVVYERGDGVPSG